MTLQHFYEYYNSLFIKLPGNTFINRIAGRGVLIETVLSFRTNRKQEASNCTLFLTISEDPYEKDINVNLLVSTSYSDGDCFLREVFNFKQQTSLNDIKCFYMDTAHKHDISENVLLAEAQNLIREGYRLMQLAKCIKEKDTLRVLDFTNESPSRRYTDKTKVIKKGRLAYA